MFMRSFNNYLSYPNRKRVLVLALTTSVICSALFFVGCGFTMRGYTSFPPQLRTLYFQAENPYAPLESSLKKKLRASGVVVVDNVNTAPFVFNMSTVNFGYSSDSTSTGPSTQARIYHVSLTTTFSIADAKGRTVLGPQIISHTQDLTLNANELFDTSTKVDTVKQKLQQILIAKIFDLLGSQKVAKSLSQAS